MPKIPMTPQGYQALQEKLKQLKTVERPQNIKDIETARAHGDLSENAEYHAAKEKQALIAAQIAETEHSLAEAHVIDPSELDHDKVVFGATVTLLDTETEEERTYQIVGAAEADAANGKISVESPIARSLIGQEAGAAVTVRAPGGAREFEILTIRYA